jgi:FkbM family methyltransferase
MRTARLADGTRVHCLVRSEALVLDHHVHGYLAHGITIREGDVVFDVGANIGLFGVRAVQRQPGVRVFAFEPVPPIFQALRRNAEAFGDGRLIAVECGLSSEAGEIEIDYYPNSPALSTAHADFWDARPEALRAAVRGNVEHAPPELWYARLVPRALSGLIAWNLRRGRRRMRCRLSTVSRVLRERGLDRVDLLKIDCEGAELDVLLGIEEADWPRIGSLVVEVADVDGRLATIRELLARHGLGRVTVERERGFEDTPMVNVFATRGAA